MAEAFRRGVEMLVAACPEPTAKKPDWKLPGPFDMGELLAEESDWKELASLDLIGNS